MPIYSTLRPIGFLECRYESDGTVDVVSRELGDIYVLGEQFDITNLSRNRWKTYIVKPKESTSWLPEHCLAPATARDGTTGKISLKLSGVGDPLPLVDEERKMCCGFPGTKESTDRGPETCAV